MLVALKNRKNVVPCLSPLYTMLFGHIRSINHVHYKIVLLHVAYNISYRIELFSIPCDTTRLYGTKSLCIAAFRANSDMYMWIYQTALVAGSSPLPHCCCVVGSDMSCWVWSCVCSFHSSSLPQVEICYAPIIQSGGSYQLNFSTVRCTCYDSLCPCLY